MQNFREVDLKYNLMNKYRLKFTVCSLSATQRAIWELRPWRATMPIDGPVETKQIIALACLQLY